MIKNKPVLLITSAAYVEAELESEFGLIPPIFLPLGGKSLITHQCKEYKNYSSKIIVSIPEKYALSKFEEKLLLKLSVIFIRVPENLSLGMSINYVINELNLFEYPLMIMHGDTLLLGFDKLKKDIVSVEKSIVKDYQWGGIRFNDKCNEFIDSNEINNLDGVLTGYFSFSKAKLIYNCINHNEGSFISGLNSYSKQYKLDYFIADKWYDFGHAGSFHRSRVDMSTERAFNSLTISPLKVIKTSSDIIKIEAEARWYEELPLELRLHTPAYLGKIQDENNLSYSIEYLHLPTLSEIFCFGKLNINAWKNIIILTKDLIEKMSIYKSPSDNFISNDYFLKTLNRIVLYSKKSNFDIYKPLKYNGNNLPCINFIIERLSEIINSKAKPRESLVHGDFCLSNLFYESRSGKIRMIDPRGLDFNGNKTIWGDLRYDIAKLHHSFLGLYDLIIADKYELIIKNDYDFELIFPEDSYLERIQQEFSSFKYCNYSPLDSEIASISILLFISMLPLHSDNPIRQKALLANSMRMYHYLDKEIG